MSEDKQNPKLKEFSFQDLLDEIANRSEVMVVATEKVISLKKGCDLHRLSGFAFQAVMTIAMTINQAEAQAKAGGIVIPGTNIPSNIRGH